MARLIKDSNIDKYKKRQRIKLWLIKVFTIIQFLMICYLVLKANNLV